MRPVAGSIAVDEALVILKIAFLVLLYLFIWRIVRTASRDVRQGQESVVLSPAQIAELTGTRPATPRARLVVATSRAVPVGRSFDLGPHPFDVGRSDDNDLAIDGDTFASGHHARFEARPDGIYVEDLDSTNGTFVNGGRIEGTVRLRRGDVVRIGATDLRLEQ